MIIGIFYSKDEAIDKNDHEVTIVEQNNLTTANSDANLVSDADCNITTLPQTTENNTKFSTETSKNLVEIVLLSSCEVRNKLLLTDSINVICMQPPRMNCNFMYRLQISHL